MKQGGENSRNGEVGKLLSSDEIDRIYGLEPVINISEEPSAGGEGTQCVVVACPYCGESYETRIDMTGGSFEYVEDCQICCQPITMKVEVNEFGELAALQTLQLNDCT